MDKKKIISISINFAIITATIIGLILAIFDLAKMGRSYEEAFKYYTTLSNLFLFISAILMAIFNFRCLYKKQKPIPKAIYIIKNCATAATTITMITVICFLTPVAIITKPEEFSVVFLYSGSNCIFHVINPVLGIIGYMLFETNREVEFPHCTFSVVFTALYEIYYTTGILLHPTEIKIYDWYNFTIFGTQYIIPMLILFLGLTFLFSWLLWLGNVKIHILESKKKVASR